MVQIYSRYCPPPSVDTTFEGESLTQQHFADECDINNIIARFDRTGVLVDPYSIIGDRHPMFGDFSSAPDFQAAQQLVIDAHSSFMTLPARVRDRFHNDPAELMVFLGNKENYDEAVSLGLVDRRNVDANANGSSTSE